MLLGDTYVPGPGVLVLSWGSVVLEARDLASESFPVAFQSSVRYASGPGEET
eukprot:gnl/Chilomastix_caulleri/894.p2 GENE.gnl/Chilomastix_caulleri/894~~gnl/Chilomastix_caulleri/894.p2  ORF type:complete len:52 (-),score=13.61 gnl/Chilomastix_caulleri/894:240-395(-)